MAQHWNTFANPQALAEALADRVAAQLDEAIKARGSATLAVSGGGTPPPFFKALSRRRLDWKTVTVTLADERFVPASSARSNARLVAQHLLQNAAARASFIDLFHDTDSVEEAAAIADSDVAALPLPLDVVVLGMGTDGHTASFFPDADDIAQILDPADTRHVLPVHAPAAVEPRLTLSMPVICNAGLVVLHIEGEDKKRVLETALGEETILPVRAVLENCAAPAEIFWAPKEDTKP